MNPLRTFIANATYLDGTPVQREISARDNMEAFALLEAEGLHSIRLREVSEAQMPPQLGAATETDTTAQLGAAIETAPQLGAAPSARPRPRTEDDEPPTVKRRRPVEPARPSMEEPALTRPMPVRSSTPINEPAVTRPMPVRSRTPIDEPQVTRPMPVRPIRQLALVDEMGPLDLRSTLTDDEEEPRSTLDGSALLARRKPVGKPVDAKKRAMPAIDRLNFFNCAAAMLNAGIPLLRVVMAQEEQYTHPVSRASMAVLAATIEQGKPLSAAMAMLPKTFSRLQIGSIKGAEQAGNLPRVMERLHQYDERTMNLTRQVQSHMTYPILVFTCAFVLVLFVGRALMTGILPVLSQARVELSGTTAFTVAIARALDNPWIMLLLLATAAGAIWQFTRWVRTPQGRVKRDRFLLRAPLIGSPLRKVETVRICEAIGTLYGSGMTLLQALEAVAQSMENVEMRAAMTKIALEVKEGRTLSQAMARTGLFDQTVAQLVFVGEETGNLNMAFTKIAQYNELEVRTALEQFTAAIEPVMLVALGTIVGVIAMMAFAPLYQLINAF